MVIKERVHLGLCQLKEMSGDAEAATSRSQPENLLSELSKSGRKFTSM
ncbi:MAG: hypothetical protein HWQ23_30985 [Nostoc sp. JL33]|nr:hypothetical protein [Nostoc sp. JL33]MBN3874536.1 hypothetical protein [Nostoc sp. JL33]